MSMFTKLFGTIALAMLLWLIPQNAAAQDAPPDYIIDVRGGDTGEISAASAGNDVYGQVRIWQDGMRIAIDIVNPIGAPVSWKFDGRKDAEGLTNSSRQVFDQQDAFRYGQPFFLYLWVNGTPLYTSQFIVPDVNYGPIWSWLRLSDVDGECVRGEGQTDPDSLWVVTDDNGNKLSEFQFHLGNDEWSTPWMPLPVNGPAMVNIEAKYYSDGILRTTAKFTNIPNLCYRPAPQIAIQKETSTPRVNAGQPIQFSIVVSSTGNAVAHSVQLMDPLPMAPGISWSILAGPEGSSCVITENVLNCALGDMPAGTSKKVVLGSPTQELTVPVCGDPLTVNNIGYATSTDAAPVEDDGELQILCNPKPSWAAMSGQLVIYKNTGNTALFAGALSIPGGSDCSAQFDRLEPGEVGYFYCATAPLLADAMYGDNHIAPTISPMPESWELIEIPTTIYVPSDPIFTPVVKEVVLNQCVYAPVVSK